VSTDVIGRRRAVEERLRRARDLARALDQAAGDMASGSGQGIESLDPDGTLRTAVSTLAGVAALRPGFDVLVSLPGSALALRVRHETEDVDITLVRLDTAAAAPSTPIAAATVPTEPVEGTPAAAVPAQAGPPVPADPLEPESVDLDPAESDGHVVSDLAAMLWQGLGPPAS
jgi:hypothetical protein